MTNLLHETRDIMRASKLYAKDVVFIGSIESGHSCTWDQFKKLADFEYDSGYGGAEVATDLTIVFSDGAYMTRGEYDGSEWWSVHRTPKVPPRRKRKPIEYLISPGGSWPTLDDLHDDAEVDAHGPMTNGRH